MNLTIKATKTTLTLGIKSAIADKLSVLDKFLKQEDKVHVECEVDKHHKTGPVYRAEVTIHPHGFFAESFGADFYEALDLVVPKIKQQMVKVKDKRVSRRKAGR